MLTFHSFTSINLGFELDPVSDLTFQKRKKFASQDARINYETEIILMLRLWAKNAPLPKPTRGMTILAAGKIIAPTHFTWELLLSTSVLKTC